MATKQGNVLSYECITIRKPIIDLCGGINEALVLEYLMSGKLKRVSKEGKVYFVARRTDWYKYVRISAKQYDAAVKKLVALGFVETKVCRCEGRSLATHIWVNHEAIRRALSEG